MGVALLEQLNCSYKDISLETSGETKDNSEKKYFRFTFGDPSPLDYTVSFDEALKEAVMAPPAERQKAMAELLLRHDARQAHPTFEHLLPIHIGAGAAGVDCGERLWTLKEGSMSWAQFRFGDAPA